MAVSSGSDFVSFITPPGDRMALYDRTRPPTDQPANAAADPAKALPPAFLDAMRVREEVYVREQHVPLENELDAADARAFHWVAYASVAAKGVPADDARRGSSAGAASTKLPIGTIRLVPPPHPDGPHGADAKESYVQLGRLAVVRDFRKTGISALLINTALAFVRAQPYDLLPARDATQAVREETGRGTGADFAGLVLVHAQTGVQKVWARYGFERDEGMGTWMEEGMEHVGMWKRVDVSSGRRRSKVWLGAAVGRGVE